ncbi:MAG: enoyl-CoA hydratase/isomerase family protein [Rhodospirillaceae bacterium]|nr:enoyl-CoA hydratase/isomerase family protein [Rhodospirillaceae bacterium]
MTDDATILVAADGPLTTVTLNRPGKLNALTPAMVDELHRALDGIEADADCRVVLLTSASDKAFCAGADVDAWSALASVDMWRRWAPLGHRLFDRVAGLRQPVIAAIGGLALGGGLELALACDLRIAGPGATFALPEVTIATLPGWGGTQRLPAVIGLGRAKEMILTGRRIDAATAESWGLVNAVAPEGGLPAAAQALAARIAGNAPISVQAAKQLVDAGLGRNTGPVLEALAGAVCLSTRDAQEGIAALKERRKPAFEGG